MVVTPPPVPASALLQALTNTLVLSEDDKDADLLRLICQHFQTRPYSVAEKWVLSHDYGWSARRIAVWENPSSLDLKEIEIGEQEIFSAITKAERYLEEEPARFEREISAFRVYLLFHFLEFEPQHRAEALAQGASVYALCGESFFQALGQALRWDAHQILEAGKGIVE